MSKWIARLSMFALFMVICSLSSAALAQDEVSVLSQYLDQTAASNNLPTGDGNISPVEQSLASTLIESATGYNQSLKDFAQSSPDNSAWIAQAQQNLQNSHAVDMSEMWLPSRVRCGRTAVAPRGCRLSVPGLSSGDDLRSKNPKDARCAGAAEPGQARRLLSAISSIFFRRARCQSGSPLIHRSLRVRSTPH